MFIWPKCSFDPNAQVYTRLILSVNDIPEKEGTKKYIFKLLMRHLIYSVNFQIYIYIKIIFNYVIIFIFNIKIKGKIKINIKYPTLLDTKHELTKLVVKQRHTNSHCVHFKEYCKTKC